MWTKEQFKTRTDAGPFARRCELIRAIDDLLAQYPKLRETLKCLAAARIIDYCNDYIEQVTRSGKPSKRLRGVYELRGEAQQEWQRLSARNRVRNRFLSAMRNPKFKTLGEIQRAAPGTQALQDNEVLEALDDLHRAGHGLQKIQQVWQASHSTKNFWDFLEEYVRAHPQEEPYRVKYLDENDRRAYEVRIQGGTLWQGQGAESHLFDTTRFAVNSTIPANAWGWGIFVLSSDTRVYSGSSYSHPRPKPSGNVDGRNSGDILHHSSFLAGRPVRCAGEWAVRNGHLRCVTPRSGHYQPPVALFKEFLLYLRARGVLLDRLAVAWPWPGYNDRRFYNAERFLWANQVEFKQQPRHNGVALAELASMDDPHSDLPRRVPPPPPRRPHRLLPPIPGPHRGTLVIPRRP